jgi:hypothetical protein
MARPGWRRQGERAGTDPLYESALTVGHELSRTSGLPFGVAVSLRIFCQPDNALPAEQPVSHSSSFVIRVMASSAAGAGAVFGEQAVKSSACRLPSAECRAECGCGVRCGVLSAKQGVPRHSACGTRQRHLSRRRLRLQLPMMAGVARDAAEGGFAFGWCVFRKELLVDRPGHLDHLPCPDLPWVFVAGEIPPRGVTATAADAQRLHEALHLLFELRHGETHEQLDSRALNFCWVAPGAERGRPGWPSGRGGGQTRRRASSR